FGGEMRDVVEKVTLFDRETGEITDIPGEDMGFGYRKSILKGPDPLEFRYVILGVLICLKEGDKDEIIKKMTEIKDRRVQKQPLTYPSAGSVFKRPEGYFAGKLIEDAGMKGAFVGGAQVSEMHAGFIINRDNATSGDVKALIRQVQDKVYSQSGVRLEREIIYL
nr:UDP-N-acetylenolpyruvoylglucosamine reductase [Lachnospiraceae bacterium]